jgi:iduronate 2-sulfatase
MSSNPKYKNREFFLLTALLIFMVVSLSGSQVNKSENDKPNILFIAVDDLNMNLACYGDTIAISPNIDKLAHEGILFTRAYCQQASCAPSRTSLLTGRRPDEIGVVDHVTHFRDNFPETVTLPQLFKSNGYKTISIGKIFHFAKGFQDSISWSEPELYKTGIKKEQYVLPKNRSGGKAASTECVNGDDDLYWDGQIAGEAVRYLRQFESEKTPFFLAVGFLKPHLPFCAPKKYWDLYDNEFTLNEKERAKPVNAPDLAFHQLQELRGYKDIPKKGPLTLEQEKKLLHGYYACISYVDAQIGKIINELKVLGMAENTIIVLWSDHGYHTGDFGLWCKATNFEAATRVPLIFSGPGISKGLESSSVVELLDIYPTLAELSGYPIPDGVSGTSLYPILKNQKYKANGIALSQFVRPYSAIRSREPKIMGYSVRTPEYRYTEWRSFPDMGVVEKELYQMTDNNMEENNLAGDNRFNSIMKKLSQEIDKRRK